ncbi:MAG: flagellar biosynthetic protein FliO [Polyangiales bacterium]
MSGLRIGVFLTLFFCAVSTPRMVSAKAIEDVLLGSDAQDIIITVLADSTLNAPTIRTYSGSLRVRLYDTKDTPLMKLTGDGGAVKSVDVANGSDQTAAIVVNFTDRTRLNPTDVRVEREGGKVVLRIARGLLPALHENAPAPLAKPVTPPAAAPVAAKPVEAPKPAPVAKQEPAPTPAPVAKPEPAPVAKQEPAPAPAKKTPLGQPAPKSSEAVKDLKLTQGGDSSAIPVLLGVSALLALCYGVLRLVMKEQTGENIPAIDVIAQKRLGPRHQLVIVRAFDRDYLLSIQGGQTTVVARSSRGRMSGDREPTGAMPLPFQRAPVGDLDLAPPSGSLRAPAKAASKAPSKAPSAAPAKRPEPFEDDEVTFGGELFKAALEQRERQRDQTQANLRLEAARAEARAELARLEAERDEINAAIKPSLPSASVDDEELVEAPKAADAMMSESVSGLLRLRKASGR